MASIDDYRGYVRQILQEYSSIKPSFGDIRLEAVTDTAHDRYQLMSVGWHGEERVYGCIFHLDIQNGKIWIQHDGTEVGIANELVKLGVPKSDIVLAFHSPYVRPYTGFAVN